MSWKRTPNWPAIYISVDNRYPAYKMKIQAVHSAGENNRGSSRQLAIYELNRAVGILENKIRLARDNMRWLRNESKALSGDLTAMAGSTDVVQRDLKVACDDLAKLQMALETDRYLTNVIGKLIHYEKSIRLVVCYVNPGRGSGQPEQPCGRMRCAVPTINDARRGSIEHPVCEHCSSLNVAHLGGSSEESDEDGSSCCDEVELNSSTTIRRCHSDTSLFNGSTNRRQVQSWQQKN